MLQVSRAAKRSLLPAALAALCLPCADSANASAGRRVGVPLTPLCRLAPSQAAKLRTSGASATGAARYCHRYGRAVRVPARVSSALCLRGGCAWIVLYNEGGGWAFSEYGADPYKVYGGIWYGAAAIKRYNARTRKSSGWTEKVDPNCGGGNWCGYRQQRPGAGWVEDTLTGWCYTTLGYLETIGPVSTWSYIT